MVERRPIQIATPALGEQEWQALREPIMSGWITQGPKVAEFERLFAERHQVKYAIATTSCTTALHLILVAMGIGPGDQVVVPSFTWIASANAVAYCGAEPVLVDVDPITFNLDFKKVRAAITPKTKAVMAVHLFGLCVDMENLREVCGDIPIIEDAACAAGAMHRGRPAGSLGIAGAFSFHPRKIITTGEGGMVTTDDDSLAEKVVMMRNHGASISEEQRHNGPKPYFLPEFNLLGFNYRMTDLQGAVGIEQIKKLDYLLNERRQWAEYYQDALSSLPWLNLPTVPSCDSHSWQSFVCLIDKEKSSLPRDVLMEKLQRKGISTRPGTHAIHQLGLYSKQYFDREEDFAGASLCARSSLTLPLHNRMESSDYRYVVEQLLAIDEV